MDISPEQIEEGLGWARQSIACLERIDFDELAEDASFQKDYAEGMIVVIKMFTILEQATLSDGQHATLTCLIERYNRWAADMALDVLDHWSEQAYAPGMMN